MEGKIGMSELKQALKGMKKGKASGCDGLPMEFYVIFFNKISDILLDTINYAYKTGKLHSSALRAMITLIPKKLRDQRVLTNLHPISLLNTDYKLIEKVLTNRLKPALTHLINEDQKGFLCGRHICTNIRRILDLIEYAEEEDIPGVILSIDYMKCFDRIELSAILGALRYFGAGESFLSWAKLLYNGSVSCIINQVHLSGWFKVTHSVKQGTPCSAYFFLLIAEIVALELRANSEITGIMFKMINKILGQFADDMDLYLFGNDQSIKLGLKTIENFSHHTGLKINYDKTTMYHIGSIQKMQVKYYTKKEVKWTNDNINVLGVNVSTEKDQLIKINYDIMILKITAIMQKWRRHNLTLIGKTLIVNSLIVSLFTYKMYVLPPVTEKFVSKVEELINNFLWNGRKAKISLKTLQLSKEQGGLGLIDLRIKDKSLKFAWVNFLNEDTLLQELAYRKLNKIIREEIWSCNLDKKHVLIAFRPSFWSNILEIWCEYNYEQNITDLDEIGNQIIWYNSHILVNGKTFFNAKMYKEGLKYVSQLVDNNGKLLESTLLSQMFNGSVMLCNQILAAIPKEWVKKL